MKKGYVFTLDAAFAVIIVAALLLTVYGYSITSYSSGVDTVSIRRVASDILAVLDYNDVLDTLDRDIIQPELNQLLPSNLNMSMTIDVYDGPSSIDYTIQINDDLTEDYFAGKWFSRTEEKYLLVKYKVGLR